MNQSSLIREDALRRVGFFGKLRDTDRRFYIEFKYTFSRVTAEHAAKQSRAIKEKQNEVR